jgi:hypothetical protein
MGILTLSVGRNLFSRQLFDHSLIVEKRIVKIEKIEGDSFLLPKMVLNLES